MTAIELKKYKDKVSNLIDKRQLKSAIKEIKDTAIKMGIPKIADKLEQVDQNYKYMLMYLAQGADDPQRKEVYDELVLELYTLLDLLESHIQSKDNPSLYYSNLRYYNQHQQRESITDLLKQYAVDAADLSLMTLAMSPNSEEEKAKRHHTEKLQSEIFKRVWCCQQLSREDTEAIGQTLEDEGVDNAFKSHLISALTLGLMQLYDKRRLMLLMKAYLNCTDMRVSSAALVGMLLGLWKYKNRPLTRKLRDILMTIRDKETWSRDLRLAFIEIIRARDTERINKKMRDEVLPRMAKLRPDIMDKIEKANLDIEDPMSLQENPEWQEMLEKSGVADQLKELTEIQMEGGDVMMSTFAHLKYFPFFNNISNWFLPFDRDHTAVTSGLKELDVLADMIDNLQFLCDSDKYSFVMSLEHVPAEQRDLMVSQLKGQSEQIYDMMGKFTNDGTADSRRMALNSYMQNIYRFFKLFYRKEEFFDPFLKGVNLITVPSLSEDFNDTDMLGVVAEFYFKLKYMQDAIDVYTRLEELSVGDAPRYQKMGYCYESLNDYDHAIEYYERAELLDSRGNWATRRLAYCYRAKGDKATAIQYYRRLAESDPDNMNAAMMYGQSLLENKEYQKALQEFYKIEYLDEESIKALRPIAWTLFMTGDLDGATSYYSRILDDEPSNNDYLNFGHVNMAKGQLGKAIEMYGKALKAYKGDNAVKWLNDTIESDKEALEQAGVDLSLMPMVADASLMQN